jgi:hypothetical protein
MHSVPYVIVLGPGRSGTTIVQAILNGLPHVSIKGENNNFFYWVYKAHENLVSAGHRPLKSSPTSPWFGYEQYRPESYM